MKDIVIIGLFFSFLEESTFVKFLQKRNVKIKLVAFFGKEHVRFISKTQLIIRELKCCLKFLLILPSLRNKKVFCLGGHYAVLFLTKIFAPVLGVDFKLYLYNFYLHAAGERKVVQRILRFLLKRDNCTLIVQSPHEIDFYKALSSSIQLFFVPCCADLFDKSKMAEESFPEGGYVFTGGYTNRDYELLISCAQRFPDEKFIMVASALNAEVKKEKLPDNITLYTDIPRLDFESLVSGASIVIVPLKNNVGASGQILCLSAMQNKKPIIYSDVSAINYYFNSDSGVPYKMGDIDSLTSALSFVLEQPERRKRMGEEAYENYKNQYTTEHRDQRLFDIIN